MDKNYRGVRVLISNKIMNKLRVVLKTYETLKDIWKLRGLNIDINILIQMKFIDFIIRIILNKEC